jgi:beta-glucosidase
MAIHEMKEEKVDLSETGQEKEAAVLNLNNNDEVNEPAGKLPLLDLRDEKNSIPDEKVLDEEKATHRKKFEARIKRLEQKLTNKIPMSESSINNKEETIDDYILNEEEKIREQIKELGERLEKISAIQEPDEAKIKELKIKHDKSTSVKELKTEEAEGISEEGIEMRESTESAIAGSAPKPRIKKLFSKERHQTTERSYEFPEGFLWGTATSAYQIEGGITNNWSRWERHPRRQRQLRKQGKRPDEYICRQACDSYNRYEEDFDLAKGMHNNAIRFGLEWSRIQPKKDTWDIGAINHYRDLLAAAKKRGLKTVVTLWHWTIPIWLAREKGWENEEAINYFTKYVELVIKELGADIDYWVTLNEPMVPIGFGYIRGNHPPGKKWNLFPAYRVYKNLVKAHQKSYQKIHEHFSNAQVGMAMICDYFEPLVKWDPLNWLLVITVRYFHHRAFLNRIEREMDFIGFNYYFHNRISYIPPFKFNKNERVNEMGWELYPSGIYHVLSYLKLFDKPILITENGIADHDDDQRPTFLKNHLRYIHMAIEEGADVRGYFHWSLLDNFEWAWGWTQKFGLYEMDRETFERKARPSAKLYADICLNNRVKT